MKEEIQSGENAATNEEKDYNHIQGKIFANPPPGEEIVISGIAGTFPNSNDVYHFQHNLFNKINMVLPNRRWDYEHPEIPVCSGSLPECAKYDAGFFGVHSKQADAQDTMGRILIEKAVEAIFDAGLSLADLEGTNTGVYVGTCFSESEKSIFHDNVGPVPKYGFTGCTRSSMAFRISYFLKLKGPSFISDTACSSSLFALEAAFRDLRLGLVDNALVCGANVCFHPFVSLQFSRLGVLSLDGQCKVFDKLGNGYARSEAIGAMLLQRSKAAKRKYSDVVYVKTNCDGFKEAGITYPSGEAQCQLLTEFYRDAGVDPASLSFLEAHGTGTFVGDPEECSGVDEVLAKCRKVNDPLLVGSVKSNIGHSEPASGMCSIVKCIIGLETGFIPPNINFTTPRESIQGIVEGRMKVVAEKMPFQDKRGLVGINSFGFGGGNCHMLLKSNEKEKLNRGVPDDDIPRVTCVSGRTEESILALLDELKSNGIDAEYIRLLHDVFRKNIPNHVYRGYSILTKSGEICRFFEHYPGSKTPLYFAFGELNNWYKVGKQLMIIPTFSATIEKAQRLLLPKGVDVGDSVFGGTESKAKHQTLGCILVQLGLIDVFKQLQINPTNYFGHSFGEILAGYFDGILTFKQTVLCAFVIDDVVDKVGELPDKYRGNNKNTIFANFRAAFKSPDCARIKKNLLSNLSNVLDMPKNRRKGEEEKFGSAEYFLNALKSESAAKFEYVESNSIVLSCGVVPSLDGTVPDDVRIIQIGDTEDNLVSFLRILGNLYVNGYNPLISKLYPDVKFPVSRGTRMISPFIKWNHHRDWFTPSYDLQATNSAQHGARKVKIHFGDQQWAFARGHVIDGRVLFPATGYLYLVWETMALIEEMPMTVKNVVFEDVRFVRASTLPKRGYLIFRITINRLSGGFEITEGDSIVVSGKIHSKDNEHFERSENFYEISDELTLSTKDVYKELRLRGYNYSGGFRSIEQCNVTATRSLIKWEDNWTTFMDNLLQLRILQTDTRLLYVPTYIQQLVLPAKQQLEFINTNYLKLNRKPVLPAYCDDLTGEIRCGYLKIKGLMASSINKRKDLGVPVLESYQFVPNVTELTLGESMRVNMQIFCENSLVKKLKIVELVDEFTADGQQLIIPLVQSAFEDQPLMTPLCKVLSKKAVETTVQIEDKELKSERDCHIIVGSCLLSRPAVVKTAFDSLKDNGFIISRENLEADVSNATIQNFTIFTVHTTPSEIIVFLKKTACTKELTTIKVSSTDFAWLETAKDLIKLKKTDNLLLYAEHDPLTGCLGLVNCLRREPDSPFVRALILLDSAEEFSPHSPFYKRQLDKHMAVNVWKNHRWGTYRHLPLPRPPPVRSQHCYANTTVRGDISSLRWIESYLKQDMSVPVEKELVRVHYAALNFRDVMTASGKINNDVITRDRIEQECVQGFEFSGLDRNGRRVMGMVTQGALSSLILADKYLVFDVPDAMSLEEAATIPVVYGTVIYGMIIRGRLRRNESVLIHSGTGGIGQAAIRLALHYGCTVFTTVGTQEKREYLLRTFPEIDERHIGNSRDLSFERMVIAGTAGRGVDMVINSLAERKQIASVRCLGAGGRFVEIGKFDLASNSDLSLLLLDKGASFHGVMLDSLMGCTPEVKREITGILNDNIGTFVVPLTSTVFGYEQVEDAFRYMSTGKHMGKVLIRVRDGMDRSVRKFDGIPRYYCYPDKTYVIVGGLGGFGLELADWLVLRGAKNLVLTSRRGITTGYQKLRTNTWISYGVNVRVSKEDVTSESGCANMLKEAGKLGEVHAIFNLAVVLADSLFENQTDATFKTSFGPKAIATMHLDNISRKLCPRLRDFVVFSSVSCGRGNAGQTNYGMSNSIMERICEKRKLEGYPALAIQWGAVGDVGLVAELQEEHVALEIGGTLQQKISNCLNVLNAFLRQTEATVVSSIVVAEKRGLESCDNIVDTVINILGLNTSKAVSHHATLPELGMDSMTGVEIKQTLEREYEIFLTPKDIKSMTLAKLKEIQEQKCISSDDSESNDIKLVLEDVGEGEEARLVEVRLNPDLVAGVATKVLLFPGIEGFARKFKILAANLVAPAVAFQFWETTEFATIQDIARSLLPAVEKHVEKGEKFNFVLYSFGSLIGLEIVHLLELKGYVGNVVIIDGGTVLMKQLAQSWLQESERMFETGLLSHLLSFYLPTEVISENQEKLLKCDTWKERLEVAKDIIRPITPDKLELHTKLANGFYNRIKAIDAYSPSYDKLKSKLRLWKPAVGLTKDIEEDYGLSRISESPIDIETFDGNHLSILHNRLVAESINSIITSIN